MNNAEFADATLVLVGHGSTLNADSSAPVFQHAAELRRRRVFSEVHEAFWKQEPKITSVVQSLKSSLVYIVPVFISEGYFSEQVIPEALGFAIRQGGGVDAAEKNGSSHEGLKNELGRVLRQGSRLLVYCRPLGTHESMTNVLLARARDVLRRHPFPREPRLKDVSLFVAGHGTGQTDQSRASVEHQVELIRRKDLFASVQPVFIEEEPPIAACYELATTDCIVIVPFFISDGLHVREDIPVLLGEPEVQVRLRLEQGLPTWRNPSEKRGKLVWCSPAVGSEPLMAEVILERVREGAKWTMVAH